MPNNINVNINRVILTGRMNSENSKNIVNLEYNVLDTDSGLTFPAMYSADIINLLSGPEMGIYLNQEVEEQGYVEDSPRVFSSATDKKLWIIGAVLGPIAILIGLFWLISFIYYKCVRPRNNKEKLVDRKRLNEETSSSVS